MNDIDTGKIIEKLEELEKRLDKLERVPGKQVNEGKVLSLKEFMLNKKPSDDLQKTLVIGYYLEHYSGEKSFNVRDLVEGFRSARESVPGNVNNKVDINIRKGHMMDAKEKKDKLKAWVLTNSGEKFVGNELKTED